MSRLISRKDAAVLLDVNPQTVTNWADRGILHPHHISKDRGILYFDKSSIEKLFDSLNDLSLMEKNILLYKKVLSDDMEQLSIRLKEMTHIKHLFGDGLPPYFLMDIFKSVLIVAGDTVLTHREKSILEQLLAGVSVNVLADSYNITVSRVYQLARKSLNIIATMTSWPDVHTESKRLRKENARLTELLSSQRSHIKELEERLSAYEYPDNSDRSLSGVSAVNLSEILSHRIDFNDLSVRCVNGIKSLDIETVGDLVKTSRSDLLKVRFFGKKSIFEVENYLSDLGLSLGMDINLLVDKESEYYLKKKS